MSNPEIIDFMQVVTAFYFLFSTIAYVLIIWGLYDLKTEIEQLRETIKKLLQNR